MLLIIAQLEHCIILHTTVTCAAYFCDEELDSDTESSELNMCVFVYLDRLARVETFQLEQLLITESHIPLNLTSTFAVMLVFK